MLPKSLRAGLQGALFTFCGVLGMAATGTAGAAGLLTTSQAVSSSPFCQQYKCSLTEQDGRQWWYRLNTDAHFLLVTRQSAESNSRISRIALLADNGNLNADMDRRIFADVQKLALGFVSNAGRLEPCYALNGGVTRVISSSPDERTAGLYCDWNEAHTQFIISANQAYLNRTANKTAVAAGPTKLNEWYFTGCTSASGNTDYLPTGVASRCNLLIETKGQVSALTRAEFQYEIEYVQDGKYVKKLLPEKEYWWPSRQQTGLDPKVSVSGRVINANLGLKVKDVQGRRVISLNAIARLTFANGVTKTAYEPLTVR